MWVYVESIHFGIDSVDFNAFCFNTVELVKMAGHITRVIGYGKICRNMKG